MQIKRGSTNLAGPYSGSLSQQPAVTADLMDGDVTVQFTSDDYRDYAYYAYYAYYDYHSDSPTGFRMRWKAGWS